MNLYLLFTINISEFANYESSNEASSGMNNIFKTLDLNNNGKIEANEIDNSLEGKNYRLRFRNNLI